MTTEAVPADRSPTSWAPRWATVTATSGLGLALVVMALTAAATDPVGTLLAAVAAAAVLAIAGYDALVRPTLVVGPDGVTVRTGWRRRHYPWPAVTAVRVTTIRRLLVLHAVEIDAGDDLVFLSRRRLGGGDLAAVAEELAAYGAPVAR